MFEENFMKTKISHVQKMSYIFLITSYPSFRKNVMVPLGIFLSLCTHLLTQKVNHISSWKARSPRVKNIQLFFLSTAYKLAFPPQWFLDIFFGPFRISLNRYFGDFANSQVPPHQSWHTPKRYCTIERKWFERPFQLAKINLKGLAMTCMES